MKYIVFAFAALGVPPLAALLWFNLRWARYVIWGMLAALCVYQATSINFFSHEEYLGSARGMEVSLIHLLALALLLALVMRKKIRGLLPEGGFRIYAVYFLLCLPSLSAADDRLISWFELWKMMAIFVVYLAVFGYLKATDNIKTLMWGFVFVVFVNFPSVVSQHFSAHYQARGIFPHWNCMAMALHLFGSLFFAYYLMNGTRTLFGKVCLVAFICDVISTFWSYSRGAFAVMPFGYGITLLVCLLDRRHAMRTFRRLLPIALVALIGLFVILPRIVQRFATAPKASSDTRVELAYCALEMIKDEPLRGVGINNWSLKMDAEHPYQDNASKIVGRELDYTGIVETVYLLVGAECGIPALVAMLVWFGWYWVSCVKLLRRLLRTRWYFIPAGLLGGLTADYMQSVLEWVLRQQMNIICLLFMFAIIAYLNTDWRRLLELEQKQE